MLGLERFSLEVLDACTDRVGVIKPQVAFFERFGSAGFAVLEKLAARAAQTELLVIMDAKRGDIGSTMAGYTDAWLSKTAPFACDALTVSPYLGFHSLDDVFATCSEYGKGLFLLSATSNPEGIELQRSGFRGTTVAAGLLASTNRANRTQLTPRSKLGPFGVVIGATVNLEETGLIGILEAEDYVTPILAPGFGHQGANLLDAGAIFGLASHSVIASVSRSVLSAGSNGIRTSIDQAKQQLKQGLAVTSGSDA